MSSIHCDDHITTFLFWCQTCCMFLDNVCIMYPTSSFCVRQYISLAFHRACLDFNTLCSFTLTLTFTQQQFLIIALSSLQKKFQKKIHHITGSD